MGFPQIQKRENSICIDDNNRKEILFDMRTNDFCKRADYGKKQNYEYYYVYV